MAIAFVHYKVYIIGVNLVGFIEARSKILKCLRESAYDPEPRKDIHEKNLLYTGEVTPTQVEEMVICCSGKDHKTEPHDMDRFIEVHKLKPRGKMDGWYVKFYFVPNGTMFISVHR